MFVGVLRLTFRIPAARSLKDRRRAVRSFKDRVTARLRVSVAEVGGLDEHRRAVLGVAVVARDAGRCDELMAVAASMATGLREAELVDRATEIIAFGDEGAGVRSDPPGADLQAARACEQVDEPWPPVVDRLEGASRASRREPAVTTKDAQLLMPEARPQRASEGPPDTPRRHRP